MFIVWPVSGWIRIIKTVKNNNPFPDNMVEINKTVDKTLTYITKVTDRYITGAAGAAKDTVETLEALAC